MTRTQKAKRDYFTIKSLGNIPLYRDCQVLLDFTLRVTSRLPRAGGGYQMVGQKLVDANIQLMYTILNALREDGGYYRLMQIQEGIKQICIIKSMYNILQDHSNRRMINALSLPQQAEYLKMVNGIVEQIERWRAKQKEIIKEGQKILDEE